MMRTPSISVFTIFIVLIFVLIIRFSKIIPSFFLIKRAALSNLKVNFHCAHWHRFFPLRKAPPLISVFFNSLYDPFGSPCRGTETVLKPLRYKVGGPSEVYASSRAAVFLCGDEPAFTQGFAKSICPFRRAGCVSF